MDLNTIISTLTSAALVQLRGTASSAINNAYRNIKDYLKQKFLIDLESSLEKNPSSESRQKVLEEDLNSTNILKNSEFSHLLNELLKELKNSKENDYLIGIHLKNVTSENIRIKNVKSGDTAIKIEDTQTNKDISISNVEANLKKKPS